MSDHRHVWAKTGCYCGAVCCQHFGYSDGETLAKGSGMLPTGGRFYSCDKQAVDGRFCKFHSIAEDYLSSGVSISIAAVQRELDDRESA